MQSKKKYTHIFFDLDNTLWDFSKNSYFAMQKIFANFPVQFQNIDFDKFFKVYIKHNHFLWSEYRKKIVGKSELVKKRFQNTFEELQIVGIDPLEMNSMYLNEMPKHNHLIDGSLEILQYLKSKRYRLFIITNGFKEVQHRKLESAGLTHFFEKVFISEVVKTPKPGREIFEFGIKSANAKKTNSLMIGDDWDVDVLGAINFGIDAVHFENGVGSEIEIVENTVNKSRMTYKIGRIRQLKSIL